MTPSRAKTPLHETLKPSDLMMVVGLLAVFPTDLALLTQQYCHTQCLPFLIFHFFFLILFGGNEKSCKFAASNQGRSGSLRVRRPLPFYSKSYVFNSNPLLLLIAHTILFNSIFPIVFSFIHSYPFVILWGANIVGSSK